MKVALLLSMLVFTIQASATNYYVSASGNDNNSGTSTSSPWKTLTKVNSAFSSFKAGDNIYLNRGDVFYGSIIVTKSGSAGAPITISAYGSGNKPVITGFTTVSSWTSLGGNIWESSSAVSTLPYTNMVAVNGVNTAMGRWPNSTGPNTGYLKIDSHSGKNSITSKQLAGASNWTNAGVVIRKTAYLIDKATITSQSGNTLSFTYSEGGSTEPQNGFGFFIQNDPKTLDVEGEWYYNPTTKKIRIFSKSSPKDVKIASMEIVLKISASYVTIDNIAINGGNTNGISMTGSSNKGVVVQNCDISLIGVDGIFCDQPNATVQNSFVSSINSNGIHFVRPNGAITNNTLKSINVFEGMGNIYSMGGVTTGPADNTLIQSNQIDSCGFKGITFNGINTKVKNNFVNVFCFVREDGAGIYTGNNTSSGSIIDGNIVLNGIGAARGTLDSTSNDVTGISIDDFGTGISIINNTIANSAAIGIKLHKANNINVKNNTTYNNGGTAWSKGGLEILYNATDLTRNITLDGNIFFARTDQQLAMFVSAPSLTDFKLFGKADNNYYAKPINDKSAILLNSTYYNFSTWKSMLGQDVNSKGTPKSITNVNDLRLEYNATSSSKTVRLDGNYIDVKNVSYNGSITLAPYTSAVLIRNGAVQNQPPIANAGFTQTITLPSNAASLNGSGVDADGSIVSYNWSKLSGPSGGSITNAVSASTTVAALLQGTYQFVLKVTDNAGASGLDTVKVIVNAAGIVNSLVVSAGANQSITLPTSTTTLSGSGSIVGGTISSYNWTKISGPSQGTITNANAASTSVTGLVEGVYTFQLKVTDNKGSFATNNLQINVIASGDLLPAVNPSNVASGLDYKYYEASSYPVVPDFSKLTPVKTGTIINFDISVANRAETFAIDFNGYIAVPTDGQYTFYTSSDDGSLLYIDNKLVVNNDGLHGAIEKSGTIGLKAGKHSISVGYSQQTGSKVLQVSYAGPGVSKQLIPSSSLFRDLPGSLLPAVNPSGTVNGLDYKYYQGSSYSVVPDFSKITPVKTGTLSNFDISVANRAEIFAINFNGYVTVPTDGQYTFYTSSDDGSLLYIDNKLVVNNDGLHGAIEKSGAIGLKAGKHSISVGYSQQTGSKVLQVSYAGPGVSKQVIPNSALYRTSVQSRISGRGPAVSSSNLNDSTLVSGELLSNPLKIGVVAYPNPFANSIVVSITGDAGSYDLLLIDNLGRTLLTRKGSKNVGTYQQTISTASIQKGIYYLKVIQNNNSSVIKLEK